jgi:hypothetical protein
MFDYYEFFNSITKLVPLGSRNSTKNHNFHNVSKTRPKDIKIHVVICSQTTIFGQGEIKRCSI